MNMFTQLLFNIFLILVLRSGIQLHFCIPTNGSVVIFTFSHTHTRRLLIKYCEVIQFISSIDSVHNILDEGCNLCIIIMIKLVIYKVLLI